jgi:hypothetical protein
LDAPRSSSPFSNNLQLYNYTSVFTSHLAITKTRTLFCGANRTMWRAQSDGLGHSDRSVSSIVGCVLATSAAQYWTSSRSIQLESDALSWVLLLFFLRYTRRPRDRGRGRVKGLYLPFQHEVKPRTGSCWIVGVAIAAASLCSAENNTSGFLQVRIYHNLPYS